MGGRPIQLRVAGQSYKVESSAPESDLQRLADTVSAKIDELTPRGKAAHPSAVLLAALALAHELEEERARRTKLERRARDVLASVLGRIDSALAGCRD